jgi:EAL domain-containing protein (putative c-di-GMP-specific phosphodiesterase class I)
MSQTVITTLNEKMQDALLHDFNEYLLDEKSDQHTGLYRGFFLSSVFQPIFTGETEIIIGYEALLRASIGRTMPVEAKFVFRYIDETGGLILFDRICRTLHLLNFLYISTGQDLLFINIHPALLTRIDTHGMVFERILHSLSVPTDRVVIEFEESYLEDSFILNRAVRNFRDRGFKIAISDFGRECANIKCLWELSPDFVKLDGAILHDAVNNEKIRRILAKIINLIHEVDSEVVIQGIETLQQLDIARQTGAKLFQGYALSRPESAVLWHKQKNTLELSRCA